MVKRPSRFLVRKTRWWSQSPYARRGQTLIVPWCGWDNTPALFLASGQRASGVHVKTLYKQGFADPAFLYTYIGVICIAMRTDRPWGWYETIEEGHRYKVKNIEINPGYGISKQFHYHRSEHWIIVSGTAMVEIENEKFIIYENQSTFVPLGKVHKVSNPGKIPLRIVEVQSGSYLGEDDIIRVEDDYTDGCINVISFV